MTFYKVDFNLNFPKRLWLKKYCYMEERYSNFEISESLFSLFMVAQSL